MRKKIAAANWKMNLSFSEAETLLDKLISTMPDLTEQQQVIFAVPFPYLAMAKQKCEEAPGVFVAAQNLSEHEKGAYTGEVSAGMLVSLGITHVLVGHSERREYYHEDSKILAAKIDRALLARLCPVFCCGESLSIRENNDQNEFVKLQLQQGIFHLADSDLQKLVIAYEPIWAIGTGKTASCLQAQEIQSFIRQTIAEQYGAATAAEISILYGGSVKGANAAELFSEPDIDGGLVGGASLDAADFSKIIEALP